MVNGWNILPIFVRSQCCEFGFLVDVFASRRPSEFVLCRRDNLRDQIFQGPPTRLCSDKRAPNGAHVTVTHQETLRISPNCHLHSTRRSLVIQLIRSIALDEIASLLFWILTNSAHEVTIAGSDPSIVQNLANTGILNLFNDYHKQRGLTPSDVHAWVSILPALLPFALPITADADAETTPCAELVEDIYAQLETQEPDRTQRLLELREPLLQLSCQPPTRMYPSAGTVDNQEGAPLASPEHTTQTASTAT
jgi:hypothetical protein